MLVAGRDARVMLYAVAVQVFTGWEMTRQSLLASEERVSPSMLQGWRFGILTWWPAKSRTRRI
jgi:hypothetical protein